VKKILLQGSTGSIGISSLSVIAEQREHFRIVGLSAGHKEDELLEQAHRVHPTSLAILRPRDGSIFRMRASEIGIQRVYVGESAFQQQAEEENYDVLLNAVMGSSGIRPTISALSRGINVALANKETLVAAGEIVMKCARDHDAAVLPIDSEHSALQQCMVGERREDVRRLWLTTSGGPFWGRSRDELARVTPHDALAHPTWAMGPKITIDSATLFNKGLEVIEACRLFDWPVSKVDVVRQRESVIHSMIEFVDGSFKAQLSIPDMRLPILYALTFPERLQSELVESRPGSFGALHFDEVDPLNHPCLHMAFQAIADGGTAPTILSAADEIAVQAFLDEKIGFLNIADVIAETLANVPRQAATDLEEVMQADTDARRTARNSIAAIVGTHTKVSC